MKCSIKGCPGIYEQRRIAHTVRYQDRVVVIDHVPAEVCTVCGDTLLSREAVERIQEILQKQPAPSGSVPLYEYASAP